MNTIDNGKEGMEGKEEKVWTIATHGGFRHPDELIAIWLMKKYGENMFPGIGNARTIFINAGHNKAYLGKTAVEHANNGILLVDVGGGAFDHSKDGQNCSAARVAQALQITNLDEMALVAYALKNDLAGKTNEMDFARLLKEISRHPDAYADRVMSWGFNVLDAFAANPVPATNNKEERRTRLKMNQKMTDMVIAEWIMKIVSEDRSFDRRVVEELKFSRDIENGQTASIVYLLDKMHRQLPETMAEILHYALNNFKGNQADYDLSEIIGALYLQAGSKIEPVYDAIFPVLNDIYFWQNEFQQAKTEFSNAKIFQVFHRTGKINVASIESDNLMMSKVARVDGNNLAVLAQISSKQVYISPNKKIIQLEEMKDVVALLRLAELKALGREGSITDWNLLRAGDTLPEVAAWHFQEAARAIFNRSLGNNNAPRTRLDAETIHRIIAIALDINYMPGCGGEGACTKRNCELYLAGCIRCRTKRWADQSASKISNAGVNNYTAKKPASSDNAESSILGRIGTNSGISITIK